MNRYHFSYKCSVDIVEAIPGYYWLTVGTFVRNPLDPSPGASGQGQHYYHFLNTPAKAGEWTVAVLNRQVQARVSLSGELNYPEDVSWNAVDDGPGSVPVHYWDGMTHYYFGPEVGYSLQQQGVTCYFGPVTLSYVTGEPDGFVSNISAAYNPSTTKYNLSWNGVKHVPGGTLYDVVYSTSEIHALGFSNATSGGTVTSGDDTPHVVVNYSTPTVSRSATMYVAMRPHMYIGSVVTGGAIQVVTGPPLVGSVGGPVSHMLSTGDQVTVAGVCANANGTRTVTVVDIYTVSLDGTSGACSYSGTGGAITTTSNTTGFSEINITPPVSATAGSAASGKVSISGKAVIH